MMRSLRTQVLDLPPNEQLEHALYLIDEITGQPDAASIYLKRTYGMTPGEARILCALNACSPRPMTREAIFATLNNEDTKITIVDVYVCKIRKKLRTTVIETLWGLGYCMPIPIDIPLENVVPFRTLLGAPWSEQNDSDLLMMVASNSHISIIADELQRTERACLDRIHKLKELK